LSSIDWFFQESCEEGRLVWESCNQGWR
jgi:hypothetical protein